MRRLGRGDGRCPHKVLQRRRRGLSLGVCANGNAANVSGLDRAFVTKAEDDVSREKGDISGHAHVPAWFRIHNLVRAVFGTGRDLCHKDMFAGGVRVFGDGETAGNNCGAVKTTVPSEERASVRAYLRCRGGGGAGAGGPGVSDDLIGDPCAADLSRI
jgi:hypothetical protein